MTENPMIKFCENFNLKNLVKTPTCLKNIGSPLCIDLILTNKANNFQNTLALGLEMTLRTTRMTTLLTLYLIAMKK